LIAKGIHQRFTIVSYSEDLRPRGLVRKGEPRETEG
jgi:hypothetical protein